MGRSIFMIGAGLVFVFVSCRGRNAGGKEGRYSERGSGSDTTSIESHFSREDSLGRKIDTSEATLPTDTVPYQRDKNQH